MSSVDARELADGQQITADLCIVGAGPAGITLARALRGHGISVALLESGGFEPEPETQQLYAGEVTGEDYLELDQARLRRFGGSSNHWEGYCRPLDAEDFAPPPRTDLSGWPFDHTELERYYPEASQLCEVHHELGFSGQPWAERAGLPLLPTNPAALPNEVLLRSPPTRFGELYRADIVDSSDITLYHHANVVELVEAQGRVSGLRVAHFDGATQLVRAERVVLATGGIELPRLLLASDGSSPGGVGNGNDLVGRFFMEHPHLRNMHLVTGRADDLSFYTDEPSVDGQTVRGVLHLHPELREANGIGNGAALLYPPGPLTNEPFPHARGVRSLVSDLAGEPVDQDLRFQVITEQIPNARSRVRLTSQRDGLGLRRCALHWELHPYDEVTLRRTVELAAAELASLGIGRVSSPAAAGKLNYPVSGGPHHMGTTRMHEDPSQGVVDADSRVHGIENLFIAGSSVFPTGGFAQPTLTLVALALRLADALTAS